MIHVVIPTLNRYDLLVACIASFRRHTTACHVTVVDNADGLKGARAALKDAGQAPDRLIDDHADNLGVAASWNRGIRLGFEDGADWVLVSNDDIEVTSPEDIEVYERAMDGGATCAVGRNGIGMSLFAVSRGCIEKIGWFDEVFWPAYFEDWDFHRRLVLAGDDQTGVATGVRHHKSASTGGRHPLWRHNLATFSAKWGYDPQTGLCLFTTPYGGLGRGGTDL